MPRKKQKQRADKRYEYKLTLGRGVDGKVIRKSFYSRVSIADAKKKAEEYKISREVSERTGEAFIGSEKRFSDWAIKWLESYKKPFVDENTYKLTYESIVNGHLIPYFGTAKLQDIRPVDINAYFAEKSHCSESRLKKMKSILNAIFEAAIENDLCYKNPAKRVIFRCDAEKKEKKVYSDEQIARVKAFAREDGTPEVILLLGTGIRRGELLGLMWSDFDPAEATLSVKRSIAVKGGVVVANPPKWGSARVLPLDMECLALLKSIQRDSLYIFPGANRQPQTPNTWSQKLARFMKRMQQQSPDIPALTAHELRHTYGTALRRHGVDIYTIQKLLGHKDIQITSQIYVHNEIDVLRSAIK